MTFNSETTCFYPIRDLEAGERTPLLGRRTPSDSGNPTLIEDKCGCCCTEHCLAFSVMTFILIGGVAVATYLMAEQDRQWSENPPFDLVTRREWKAADPVRRPIRSNGLAASAMQEPLVQTPEIHSKPTHKMAATHVVIAHTDGEPCADRETCQEIVQRLQSDSISHFGIDDIPYNFLVGGDGQTYEGRGWGREDALSQEFGGNSISIAFIGNFTNNHPPKKQTSEARALIVESIRRRKLSSDYTVLGHRQISRTNSPGNVLMAEITKWKHWRPYKAGST